MGFIEKLTKKLESYESEKMDVENQLKKEKVWASTGIPILEWNLKTLGIKKGFIEIAGTSMAGKTTLGLTIAANYMRKYDDAICIFLLSEQRIDDNYAVRLGIDPNRLYKIHSEYLEDLFYTLQDRLEMIRELWQQEKLAGNPKVIILWDSVSATMSKNELETFKLNAKQFNISAAKGTKFEIKHPKMASFAKSARDCAKAIHAQLYDFEIIFILLNHLTDDIGNPMGGKTSTGGSWRSYFCFLRLEMQKNKLLSSKHKIDEEQWGQITDVRVIKNDFGGYKKTQLQLCLGYGFTLTEEDIDYAVSKKILKKEGEKKYSFLNGKLTWNSLRSFYNLYRNQNKLLRALHNKILNARHEDLLKLNNTESNEEE